MRPSRPWFRASKNAWYAMVNGSQRSLGEHPHGAPRPKKSEKTGLWNPPQCIRDALEALLKGESAKFQTTSSILTVATVCDRFLQFSKLHNEPKDFEGYQTFLQSFCDLHGGLLAKDIAPSHVLSWLDAHSTWKGSRRHAIIAVKRAFNWAELERLLAPSPLKGLKNTKAQSRARFLTPDQRAKLLTAIPDWQFRYFVEAMQVSGCRPSEIRRVEAKDVRLDLGEWVLMRHKNAKRTGKPRIVFLTPRLLEITKELMEKQPDGPLFRGPRSNRPFGLQGICTRFRRLRKKLRKLHPTMDFDAACAYAYRHSVADQAIKNGVPIAQTAILLGTSPEMLMHHYQHVAEDVEHMRQAARKATAV